jgi:hypothetical protein
MTLVKWNPARSAGAGPLPLINMGNHTWTMNIEAVDGTREMIVLFRGAFVGYFELQARTFADVTREIELIADGVTVVDQIDTTRPYTVLGNPPSTQVLGNNPTTPLRIGYEEEWISDNVGFGGSNFVAANTYDWRFTYISGAFPQQLSNAPDGVWVTIDSTEVSFWRWDGSVPPEFTATFQVDVRDPGDVIVGTSIFTVNRGVLGDIAGFDASLYTGEDVAPNPTDALATVDLLNSGLIDGTGNAQSPSGQWLWNSASAANYDVRLDPTAGTFNWAGGDPVNTWLNGATSRSWGVEETGLGITTATGTLRIRPTGGGADIDTASVTLTAEST